jgi:hypothetical protein
MGGACRLARWGCFQGLLCGIRSVRNKKQCSVVWVTRPAVWRGWVLEAVALVVPSLRKGCQIVLPGCAA